MNLAFFIARRTAQHTPDNKPGVMERIAVISVALSVAVMILAMAVIMGFKHEVARKVTAFAGACRRDRRAGCRDARFGARAPQRPHRKADPLDPGIRFDGSVCRQGRASSVRPTLWER